MSFCSITFQASLRLGSPGNGKAYRIPEIRRP